MAKLYTLLDNENFVLNAQYFEEGSQPENAISEVLTENFIKAKFDIEMRVFFEGATQEQQIKQALSSETEKYKQRQADGVQMYAEISAEFRLAKLNGLMSESTQSVIEKILISVRNEVLAGQWKSAKIELELIGVSNIGADLYNRLHTQISNYIAQSYDDN